MRQSHMTKTPSLSRAEWAVEIISLAGWILIGIFGFSGLADLAGLPFALSWVLLIPLGVCFVFSKRYAVPPLAEAAAGLGMLVALGWGVLFFVSFLITVLAPAPLRNALLAPFTVLDWLVVAFLGFCNLLLLIGLCGALLARIRASV